MFEFMRDPVGVVGDTRLGSWLKRNPVTAFILAISLMWTIQAGYSWADAQHITSDQGAPGKFGAWLVKTGSVTGQTCQQVAATAGGAALTVSAVGLYELIVEAGYGNVSIIAGAAGACTAYGTNGMLGNDGTDKYFSAGATAYSVCAAAPVSGHPLVQLCQ